MGVYIETEETTLGDDLGRSKSQRRRRRRRKRAIALMQAQKAAGQLTEAQYQARSAQIAGKRRAKKKSRRKKYKKIIKGAVLVAGAVIAAPYIAKGISAVGKGALKVGKSIAGTIGKALLPGKVLEELMPQPILEPDFESEFDFAEGGEPMYEPEFYTGPVAAAPGVMLAPGVMPAPGPVPRLRFTREGLDRSKVFGGAL